MAVTSLATYEEIYELMESSYFVAAIENSGGRHYSKSYSWGELSKCVDDYIGMVEYFGGGVVVVYGKLYDDYEIIETILV